MNWQMQHLDILTIGVTRMHRIRNCLAWILKTVAGICFFCMHLLLSLGKIILMLFGLLLKIIISMIKMATP